MNLCGRPIYQKGQKPTVSKRSGKDAAHLAKVAKLPCVVCHNYELPQMSPTQVHHCIHGRNSMAKKAPDNRTIPLCEGHHLGDFDTSKIALHRNPSAWKQAYGMDTDWLPWVEEQLSKRGNSLAVRGECAVDGCSKRVFAGQYCGAHYRKNLRHGDPLAGGSEKGAVMRWLQANADHDGDDCLGFPFSSIEGYYSVSMGGGRWSKAHRVMCELRHGPPRKGQLALHNCHNKSCVNPKHLRWGTPKENMQDAILCGNVARGEKSSASKLDEEMVLQIRKRWDGGETLDEIAKDFPVTRGAIWMAATGRTWAHV
jgi:hypothetical protein